MAPQEQSAIPNKLLKLPKLTIYKSWKEKTKILYFSSRKAYTHYFEEASAYTAFNATITAAGATKMARLPTIWSIIVPRP